MLKQTSSRFTMAVVAGVAIMLAVAGTSVASNMGFKLNLQLALPQTTAVPPCVAGFVANCGDNWISLPYFNPYVTANGLCTQAGLPSGLQKASITSYDPALTTAPTTVSCGTSAASALTLTPGRGIKVRNPVTGGVTSIIIVGSHNPTLSFTVPPPGSGAVQGNARFSLPYHTTAVTANDLCLSSGLPSTGIPRATVTNPNPFTGQSQSVTCGTSGAIGMTLTLGRAYTLRNPTGVTTTFIPAHF